MKQFHQILAGMRKRGIQRYLDESDEMMQKMEEFFHVFDETPPKLQAILLIMGATPRCIYAGAFALRFAHQFNADLYMLHKGTLAPLVLEQAAELQVNIVLDRNVDTLRFEEIEQLVEENNIDLVVASSRISLAKRLLTTLSVPVLFTRHRLFPEIPPKPDSSTIKREDSS